MQRITTHESYKLPYGGDGCSWDEHSGLNDVLVASELCFHRSGLRIHKTGGLTAEGNFRNFTGQLHDSKSHMVI